MSLLEKIKGQREQIKVSRAGQTRTYKFRPGKTVISILPAHGDKPEDFYREFGQHYIKNRKDEFVVAVGDRSITYGEECPVRDGIVELIRYANKIGDDELAEKAKSSLARKNYLFNIIVHQDPDMKKEEAPQLASFSETLMDQFFSILEEYLSSEDGAKSLLGWSDRLLFIVEREGTGVKDTRYKIYPAPKKQSVDAGVMTKAVNLDEYITAQFAEGVQKALAYVATASGRVASGSAVAAALSGGTTPAIAAPVVETVTDLTGTSDDDLLAAAPSPRVADAPAMAHTRVEDAVFEEVAPVTEANADALLAEIDLLAA